ncbi:MAG: AAA family ATPase [Desulfohalobiaceae bacterium]|nr:AAA family ATPase [Desulfohalobiaceae bacterium]
MALSIALSGKGGVGKTTVAGMLIRYLIEKDKGPILAVDADSNFNLNEVLGVTVEQTLGGVREEMKKGDVPAGMTKDRFMSMKLEEAIIEEKDVDLVVMGQPEGQGCYCAANTLLSDFLRKLVVNYGYVVMDNEAGMEHISRLTTSNIDYLLVVSDPSRRGLQAAERIAGLARDLNIGARQTFLILNNVRQEPSEEIQKIIDQAGLKLLGSIMADETIAEYDLQGRPTFELPRDNQAVQSAFALFDSILDGK